MRDSLLLQDLRNCHMRCALRYALRAYRNLHRARGRRKAPRVQVVRVRAVVAVTWLSRNQSIERVSRVISPSKWLTFGEAREGFLGRKLER